MTSMSGKKMFIPCLEDKYDDGSTPTGIPVDNMSLVSSNEHETESKYCFLSKKSVDTLTELMEQLTQVYWVETGFVRPYGLK